MRRGWARSKPCLVLEAACLWQRQAGSRSNQGCDQGHCGCAVPQLPPEGAGVTWEQGGQAGTLCGLAHAGCQSGSRDCVVESGWAVPVPPALADAMDKLLEVRGT